ncbi:MAG: hypothetical protein NT029_11945 [Armatimonadetes bacterium]|nr:hypothetical protein [Armatimonadota bacterium]
MLHVISKLERLRAAGAALCCLLGLAPGVAQAVEFTSDTTISAGSYSGEPVIVTGCTLTIDCGGGGASYASLLVRGAGVVVPAGPVLRITVSGDLTVESGSRIDASGHGYPSRNGPGNGDYGAGNGATHGGTGGDSGRWANDSVTTPADYGSGGGSNLGDSWPGGSGGGLVDLTVGGLCRVDGDIRSDGGGPANAGGGAGGSIRLGAATLAGEGAITANGGTPDISALPAGWRAGGGGGGRVSATWTTSTFSGQMQARGGQGAIGAAACNGGPGTVYRHDLGAAHESIEFHNGPAFGYTQHAAPALPGGDLTIAMARICFGCSVNPIQAATMRLMTAAQITSPAADGFGLLMQVSGDLTVEAGSSIDVSGTGHPNRQGTGGGDYGAGNGATYGGSGYGNGRWTYGSFTAPVDYGSGGGPNVGDAWPGGSGGGIAGITVGGVCTVDGSIRSDGIGPTNAGGGSGGSIRLQTGTLAGAGLISAAGGSPDTSALPDGWQAGGGGGGRIGIEYETLTYSGAYQAGGGQGRINASVAMGGPGTLYMRKSGAAFATLLYDNGPLAGPVLQPVFAMADLDMTVKGAAMTLSSDAAGLSVRNLTVDAGSVIRCQQATGDGIMITTAQNLTVGPGGSLDGSGLGNVNRQGPGSGDYGAGNGATYGGSGSNNGRWTYGSITAPTDLGSGGGGNVGDAWPGGSGGALVNLTVGGALTVEGSVLSNGIGPASAGGGSGGSIHLKVGSLAGEGLIEAIGGSPDVTSLPDGWPAGGGGGGRIAAHYDANTFAGRMDARGGAGRINATPLYGGPGTIFMQRNGETQSTLLYDNNGQIGSVMQPTFDMPNTDVTVLGAVMVLSPEPAGMGARNLSVGENSVITCLGNSEPGLRLTVWQNLTVAASASLDVTGAGYPSRQGTGHGDYGGGNGATYGGSGAGNGLWTYGSMVEPADFGSGGGSNVGDAYPGGAGGGKMRLIVHGDLANNGAILAEGGVAPNTGGGSGGSIHATLGSLSGNGVISADGGTPDVSSLPAGWHAGGGGGGRVALYYGSTAFTGTVSAQGGRGFFDTSVADGGPGSVYTLQTGATAATLTFDNGGAIGAIYQPAFVRTEADVFMRGAVMVMSDEPDGVSVRNLTLGPGTTLTCLGGGSYGLRATVAQNLTVQSGAAINVIGLGYPSRSGPGYGDYGAGNGATHGGSGAANGRWAYGSVVEPTDMGSGGGSNVGDAYPGGSGGGRIRLTVPGTLLLDGAIRADGAGSVNAGAGAGGSALLSVGTMAGSGIITANGGTPDSSSLPGGWLAGGGGGGRIALSYGADAFTGSVECRGGAGALNGSSMDGGPGSVYRRRQGDSAATLAFDNSVLIGPIMQPVLEMPDVDLRLRNAVMTLSTTGSGMSLRSLLMESGSALRCLQLDGRGVELWIGQDCTVAAGASIDATGMGNGNRSGAGYGDYGTGDGATYGGIGGGNPRAPYGSATWPADWGSGGGSNIGDAIPGSAGGGIVSVTVRGTLLLNGSVIADGAANGNAGAGSGGSVRLACTTLSGSGLIGARGGAAHHDEHPELHAGGGGGGRIAVRCVTGTGFPGGTVSAAGGVGVDGWNGTAGTIYWGEASAQPDVAVDPADATFEWRSDGTGTAHITVTNRSFDPLSNLLIGAYTGVPGAAGVIQLGSTTVPSLAGFITQRIDVPVMAGVNVAQIRVVADPGNAIAESREDNNTALVASDRPRTSVYAPDRTGVITTSIALKGYLKRLSDNAWLSGRTVAFRVNGVDVGAAGTDASGQATLTWVISDGPASRTIQARFDGDAEYGPSVTTGKLTAQTLATKVYVVDRTAKVKTYTVLKAYLYLLNNTPVGGKTLVIKVDGSVLGSDVTRAAGYAQLGYTVPEGSGAGLRTIRGEWAGDGGYVASANNGKLTVTKGDVYIWPYVRSAKRGTSHPLKAYVRSLPDYAILPGKSIAFSVNGTGVGSSTVASDGWASATWAMPATEALGAHTATAAFTGDPWYSAASANAAFNVVP